MSQLRPEVVSAIVRSAGGQIVGRTRLQKTAYLLDVTGFGAGFQFAYKHYGPFSEDVASSANLASLLGEIKEEERPTSWGGFYSIYTADPTEEATEDGRLCTLARAAATADSIELELAATAVFLAKEGYSDPWAETERRKPEKAANGRLAKARALLHALKELDVPNPLPDIA